MVPKLLHLLISFLFCELRVNNYCSLGGLFICESTPGYFVRAYIVFGIRADSCCLFPQCVQALNALKAGASASRLV